MLVPRFKFRRLRDRGGFNWIAQSEFDKGGRYRELLCCRGKALN